MYKYLQNLNGFESYVDYFIEGYKILRGGAKGRDKTEFLDESMQLREGIQKFKSKTALVKIIDYCITGSNDIERDFRSDEIFKSIVVNGIKIYKSDFCIYCNLFELMKYYSKNWVYNQTEIIVNFFNETNTKQKAFVDTLQIVKVEKGIYLKRLLSYFIDENNYLEIINAYNNNEIYEDFVKTLYFEIRHSKPDVAELYKQKFEEESGLEIEIPEIIDWDKINQERTQKSFSLLFDFKKFKEECLKIFEDKDEISKEKLWEHKKIGTSYEFIEDKYINSALDFIREFAENSPAQKKDIIYWFDNEKNYEFYMINSVYNYIKNKEQLKISKEQVAAIKEWYDKHIDKIEFTKAIIISQDGSFTYNRYANYLTYFMREFNFYCNENILLDMLSFVSEGIGGFETIELDYILKKVSNKKKINDRIIENIINLKVTKISAYELHVKYALENKLTECYTAIIKDLVESNDKTYKKNKIIDMYIDSGSNIKLLKDIFDKLEIDVQLHMTKRLLQEEQGFVIEKLSKLDYPGQDIDTRRIINNQLIKVGQISGLTNSIDWIKENKKNPFSQHGNGLAHFKNIETLPYLMELLELSYDEEIKNDHELDRMWSIVVDGLEFLALSSSDNFETVIKRMTLFIEENKRKLENIEFLNRPIVIIKQNYYKSRTVEFSFEDAKRKVEGLTA